MLATVCLQQCCICCILQQMQQLQGSAMPRSGGSYTTSDLSRKSGDIIAEALRRPVTITQRSKPRLILLNIDDYARLMRQSDARSAGTIESM